MLPKIFIIILNFNGWSDTKECLESLGRINYGNFEIILIDNGSNGGYRLSAMDYRFKIHEIYNKKNLGFAGANNQGIKLALAKGADYVLLLNNDTVVEPDFLNKLVEMGEKNEKAGILGPIIYDYGTDNIQSAGGRIDWTMTRGEHILTIGHCEESSEAKRRSNPVGGGSITGSPRPAGSGARDDIVPTDYLTGCCFLIKTEVIKKIGLMSEDYFLYYEDTDWCVRARRAGYNCVLAPEAKIYHKGSMSSQEFSYPYVYYHSRNGLMFGAILGNKFIVYALSVWIFLKQLIKLAVGYKRDWARPVLRGVWDFWRGKRGKLEGYY